MSQVTFAVRQRPLHTAVESFPAGCELLSRIRRSKNAHSRDSRRTNSATTRAELFLDSNLRLKRESGFSSLLSLSLCSPTAFSKSILYKSAVT